MRLAKFLLIIFFITTQSTYANNVNDFIKWKIDFKKHALKNNISEDVFDIVMKNVIYLPKVIEYDRFQPEFYEDTKTYIDKRTSNQKKNKGIDFYNKNKFLINIVENEFEIEKELLLALMGIETNFGKYVGKIDILSSLATLSYDKRIS